MNDITLLEIYSSIFGCDVPRDDDDRVCIINDMWAFAGARDQRQLMEILDRKSWGYEEFHVRAMWNALNKDKQLGECPMCQGTGQVRVGGTHLE